MKRQIYENKIRDWDLAANFELLGILMVELTSKR